MCGIVTGLGSANPWGWPVLWAKNSTLAVSDAHFSDNKYTGGLISTNESVVSVVHSKFYDNVVNDSASLAASSGQLWVTDCEFLRTANGLAIWSINSITTVSRSLFAYNAPQAVSVVHTTGVQSVLSVSSSIFLRNTPSQSAVLSGSHSFVPSRAPGKTLMFFTNCTFDSNMAGLRSGGVVVRGEGLRAIIIQRCTFTDNSADILPSDFNLLQPSPTVLVNSTAAVIVLNSTFAANRCKHASCTEGVAA